MDRADLARSVTQLPSVPVALGAETTASVGPHLQPAAADKVVLRTLPPPPASARGAATLKGVQEALEIARKEPVAALVLDLGLLVDVGDPKASWTTAGARIQEALAYTPIGRVILLEPTGRMAPEAVTKQLALA